MKLYFLPEPSCVLTDFVFEAKAKRPWLRWPLAIVLILVWIALVPPAFVLVKAGNFAHRVAGWCGLDSREW